MNRGETTKAFARSVDRGLQFSIGIVIVVKTVVFGAEATTWHDASPRQSVLIVVILGLVAVATWQCLRGRAGLAALWCCTVAMLISFWLPGATDALAGAADSPITHLAEPLLLVVLLAETSLRDLRWLPVVATINALYVGLRTVRGAHPDTILWGLQEAAFITGVAAAVYLAVHGLRLASERAEEAVLAQARETDALHAAVSRAGITFIHDELVPTLMAMSHNGDAPGTVESAIRTLRRLRGPDDESADSALTARISQHATNAGISAQVTTAGKSSSGQLPARVRAAFDGAIGEALRNVARHSGVERAEVTIVRRTRGLDVSIVDEGCGFATKEAGVGIRTSIIERMTSVGGRACIDSSSAGTTIRLKWRSPVQSRAGSGEPSRLELLRLATGDPGVIARPVALALGAAFLSPAIVNVSRGSLSLPSLAGAAAIVGLTAVALRALRRNTIPGWLLILVALVPAVVVGATLPAVPADQLGGLNAWMIDFACLPMVVVGWVGSVPLLIALLLPSGVVTGIITADAGLPTAELPHVLLLQPLNVAVVAVLAAMVRRAGRVVLRAQTDDLLADALPGRLAKILGHEYDVIGNHLEAHLSGRPDPAGSARLAHSARDSLYLPGVRHSAVRRELSRLRAAEIRVETIIRGTPEDASELACVLSMVPACPAADAIRHLHLTTYRERVLLVLTPAISSDAIEGLEQRLSDAWQVTDEDALTILEWTSSELQATPD